METVYFDHEVKVEALRLHYQEWGEPDAPAIVMLHGFGVSGHMFDEFAGLARDRYRLIALDQRGHGDSDWAPDGDYSREAFVKDFEGFCEALELGRFVLVGHSMGGLNAVAFTVRNPDQVAALVLVDVGPEAAHEGVDNIMRFTRGPDNLEFDEFVEMAHRFNPRRSIDNIRERMRHRLRQTDGGKWTWKFDKRFREGDKELRVGNRLSSEETWELFRRVTVPTLLVRGAESDVLTEAVAERVVRELPKARLVTVPAAGHSVPGDNPGEFTKAVREFLEGLDTAAPPATAGGGATAFGATDGPGAASAAAHRAATRAALSDPDEGDAAEPASRLRGSLAWPALAGSLALAVGAGLLILRVASAKRSRGREKSRLRAGSRRAAAVLPMALSAARRSAVDLINELSAVGGEGLDRARGMLDSPNVRRARESAYGVLHSLGEPARVVPATRARRSGTARAVAHGVGRTARLTWRGGRWLAAQGAAARQSGRRAARG